MLQLNKTKIMELFFEEPSRYFQIREVSRLTGIAPTSVRNYLESLRKEGLLRKVKTNIYNSYSANQEERRYRIYKQTYMLLKIQESGLITFLEEAFHPRCIVLFGSMRKGDHNKESDIDIFVESEEKVVDLKKYERLLGHKIALFFESSLKKLSDELFNNIINGIKISGYIKLK